MARIGKCKECHKGDLFIYQFDSTGFIEYCCKLCGAIFDGEKKPTGEFNPNMIRQERQEDTQEQTEEIEEKLYCKVCKKKTKINLVEDDNTKYCAECGFNYLDEEPNHEREKLVNKLNEYDADLILIAFNEYTNGKLDEEINHWIGEAQNEEFKDFLAGLELKKKGRRVLDRAKNGGKKQDGK